MAEWFGNMSEQSPDDRLADRTPPPGPRRRRWLRWSLLSLGVVIVLIVAGVAADVLYLNSEIKRVHVGGLSNTRTSGAEAQAENILLVGSTSRCALKKQNPAYGTCQGGVTGVNSDVVMILHLDPMHGSASILSIPRDTFVPNARIEGANKIDAALYEGPTQLVRAIEEDFGIPIQHYIELNFETFAGVVNALGGVRMYFPMEVYDSYSGLLIGRTGCQKLNGIRALEVVRARHLQYKGPGVTTNDYLDWPQEALSDLARIRRDHEFLRVLAAQVAHRGLGNPFTDQRIAAAIAPDLEVDSGLGVGDIAHIILEFHRLNPYKAPELTIPVVVADFNTPGGDYYYQGGNYGDVAFPTEPQDQSIIDQFLHVKANVNTMTGGLLPKPTTIRVAVQDGAGQAGATASAVTGLRALGFLASYAGSVPPVSSQAEETVVYYGSRADEAAAQVVERKLTGFVVMAYDPAKAVRGAQVTVVTGTHFQVKKPPSGLPPSVFQPPSAPVQPLAPWDPRSCTPSGGEGP
jgi:LCP family protein required for cell wall assembly